MAAVSIHKKLDFIVYLELYLDFICVFIYSFFFCSL